MEAKGLEINITISFYTRDKRKTLVNAWKFYKKDIAKYQILLYNELLI